MTRLVFHAGFPKCASSLIQGAISHNLNALAEQSIFMLGKDLELGDRGEHPDFPIWLLEHENLNAPPGAVLTERILREVTKAEKSYIDPTLFITSENLSQSGMPRLFAGLDEKIDVTIVFYIRPEISWIPSAWKQWGIKLGSSLAEYASNCVELRYPNHRASLDAWHHGLPKASIMVRPLFKEFLFCEDPVEDFFKILGSSRPDKRYQLIDNTTFDYSLLHMMYKNSDVLFSDLHDNDFFFALGDILPKKYRTNGKTMFSYKFAKYVEEAFKDDNYYILKTYVGGGDDFIKLTYDKYYVPEMTSDSYMETTDADIVQRLTEIIAAISPNSEAIFRCLGSLIKDFALKNPLPPSTTSSE